MYLPPALVLQVIEFPNEFQKIHKFYIDWDKKLSETLLLPAYSASQQSTQQFIPAKSACVEKIRQAALGTPAAVLRMLHELGKDAFDLSHMPEEEFVTVLVKEGTRKISPASSQEEEDWKISFHFVFQVFFCCLQCLDCKIKLPY